MVVDFFKNIGSHWGGGDMFLKKVLGIWSACKILIKSGGPHEVPSLAGCGIRQQGVNWGAGYQSNLMSLSQVVQKKGKVKVPC